MRRTILLGAVLAGGLTVTLGAAAEAGGRQGHGFGQPWMFPHRQEFAQPSSLRLYPLRRPHVVHFAPRPQVRCFAPGCGPRFIPRAPVVRFAAPPPVPPLSQQPGFRVLNGRQILPTVGIPVRPFVVRPVRPFVVRPVARFPTFVRVVPAPGFAPRPLFPRGLGFAPRNEAFGIPHRSGGLTIIVRDPAGVPPWR